MSDCPIYAPAPVDVLAGKKQRKNCGTCLNWDAVIEKCKEEDKLKGGG